jgi:hypothetical protein
MRCDEISDPRTERDTGDWRGTQELLIKVQHATEKRGGTLLVLVIVQTILIHTVQLHLFMKCFE